MFKKFQSQEERRKYGGSCFIELQFCTLPESECLEVILDHYDNWKNDSLYVHGDEPLYTVYGQIFGNGLHPNMTESYFDTWGITYYKPSLIEEIIERALQSKPVGYELLVDWLNEAKNYNGFDIRGV